MHKTIISILLIILTMSLGCASDGNSRDGNSKDGYRIEVRVEGVSNTQSFLGYHFGDRQYLKDTVQVDPQGHFVFEGTQRLDPGMYLVVMPEQKYFEIIVDHNQHFSVSTKMNEFVPTMQFENAPDNTAFYEYLRFIQQQGQLREAMRTELEDENTPEQRQQALQQSMNQTDQAVKERQQQYIDAFPNGLFTKVLLAQREPQMPETTLNEDGTPDLATRYQIYKERFWQNIDFSDDRLLRTPMFHSKLAQYFNRVVIQMPDSINREADRIIEKARAHEEVLKYTIWFITNNFERSQIMGMDAVFVHMVEKYYMSGQAFWIEPENLERISQRAMRLKPLLIGQTAPDLSMFRPDGQRASLRDVKAEYLVVYFWDSECSHCKKVTPELNQLYQKMKGNGLKVFGINIEADRDLWLAAVKSYGLADWINVNDPENKSGFRDKYDIYATPLIFLLDRDKKILAKRITVEQVEDIIRRDKEAGSL